MDMSEDMIKRSMLRGAEDKTAGRMGGAPSMQSFHLVGDEEYLPLQPKYVSTFSDAHNFLNFWTSCGFNYQRALWSEVPF